MSTRSLSATILAAAVAGALSSMASAGPLTEAEAKAATDAARRSATELRFQA
jgi:uncharacterized membrane protein